MTEFKGKGLPLDQAGLTEASALLGIEGSSLWSVIAVETYGVGFLPDRRPKILFERHVFSRLTHHLYDESHPEVSNPSQGGYGPEGAHQYKRLNEAIGLDRQAALMSASWGLGQVMGFNHLSAGFQDVEEMVSCMMDSERAQLLAMMKFIKEEGLDSALRQKNWRDFAEKYNGRDYAKNKYDEKLASFHEKYSKGNLPDLDVRAAQLYLVYLGYDPGPVDGVMGTLTLSALNRFLESEGRQSSGAITKEILNFLSKRSGDAN